MLYNLSGNKIESIFDSCCRKISSLREAAWGYGYGANDGSVGYDNKNTIFTPQYLFVKSGTSIESTNGYRFSVCVYQQPKLSSFESKKALDASAYIANNDCYVRISMALPTTGEITDPYSVVSHLTISNEAIVLDHAIYKDVAEAEANEYATLRFIQAMNERAQKIGMTNSVFADAAGYDTTTNRTTARDLVKLAVAASAYRDICRIWSKDSDTICTLDATRREIVCEYGDDCTTLNAAYPILGRKNGYMPLSGGGGSYTMLAICIVNGKPVVGAIGGATSRPNRPVAMKELMDNVAAIMNGQQATTPTYYTRGCAAELPTGNASMYDGKPLEYLYEYNADTQFVPASTTKVLTAITMLDNVNDISGRTKALASDNVDLTTGTQLKVGEIVTYEQLLILMMLPSAGSASRVAARSVGQRVILDYD